MIRHRMNARPREEMMMEPTRPVTGGWGMLQLISVTQGYFHLATVCGGARPMLTLTTPLLGRLVLPTAGLILRLEE